MRLFPATCFPGGMVLAAAQANSGPEQLFQPGHAYPRHCYDIHPDTSAALGLYNLMSGRWSHSTLTLYTHLGSITAIGEMPPLPSVPS